VEILSDWFGPNGAGQLLARWGHYVAGACWIGLLYYFNFVQAPAFTRLDDHARASVLREISLPAMAWRRRSAIATIATGVLIFLFQDPYDGDYLTYLSTPRGTAVAFGSVLALIMFANVWFVIAPSQRLVAESVESSLSGRGAVPHATLAAKRLGRAERCNTLLSIPMLWFMAAAPHFADSLCHFTTQPGRDYIGSAWAIFIIIVGLVELSALGQIGGYDTLTNRVLLDSRRRAVLWGLAVWAFLWIGAFEVVFGNAPGTC
jgi:hypothetical protein